MSKQASQPTLNEVLTFTVAILKRAAGSLTQAIRSVKTSQRKYKTPALDSHCFAHLHHLNASPLLGPSGGPPRPTSLTPFIQFGVWVYLHQHLRYVRPEYVISYVS